MSSRKDYFKLNIFTSNWKETFHRLAKARKRKMQFLNKKRKTTTTNSRFLVRKMQFLNKKRKTTTTNSQKVLFGIKLNDFICFLNGPTPASFCFFYLFKHKFYRKTIGFSGILLRFDGVEGEHADHLTTTTAHWFHLLLTNSIHYPLIFVQMKIQLNRKKDNQEWTKLKKLLKTATF